MDLCAQLYAPAALPPGTHWIGGWVGPWTPWWREKFPAPARNRSLEPRSSSPYPSHYTDWATQCITISLDLLSFTEINTQRFWNWNLSPSFRRAHCCILLSTCHTEPQGFSFPTDAAHPVPLKLPATEHLSYTVAWRSWCMDHTVAYPMGTGDSFPRGKAAGAWSWPLITS
jgi:hypothetical protein